MSLGFLPTCSQRCVASEKMRRAPAPRVERECWMVVTCMPFNTPQKHDGGSMTHFGLLWDAGRPPNMALRIGCTLAWHWPAPEPPSIQGDRRTFASPFVSIKFKSRPVYHNYRLYEAYSYLLCFLFVLISTNIPKNQTKVKHFLCRWL
jgi:hypothetical protein